MVRGMSWLFVVGLSLALCGCGEKRLTTVKIEGTVTVDGKPFGPGSISFSPPEGPDAKTPNASGAVTPDGKFTVDSYGPKSGIVPGTYAVNLGMDAMTMAMPPVTKPVQVTIGKDDKTVNIEMQTVKGAKPGFIPDPNSGGATMELKIGK